MRLESLVKHSRDLAGGQIWLSKLTDIIVLQTVSIGASSIAIACMAVPNICFRAVSSLLARMLWAAARKSAEDFCASFML